MSFCLFMTFRSSSSAAIIHSIFPVFMSSRFGSVSVSFYWWVGHINHLLWGWLIERQMSNGSPHIDRHKQEDTLIIDLKTRWKFVGLYILMVVSNDHILPGCDATYFDRHQHYGELVTMYETMWCYSSED